MQPIDYMLVLAAVLACLYVPGRGSHIRGDIAFLLVTAMFFATSCLGTISGLTLKDSVSRTGILFAIYVLGFITVTMAYRLSPWHPLHSFPGPTLNKITSLRWAYIIYKGKRHLVTEQLHGRYGKFVRTGPNTLSINDHSAVPSLYSSAQAMDKSDAYRPGRFKEDGLFFIRSRIKHSVRRKLWAGAFSGSAIHHACDIINKRALQLCNHLQHAALHVPVDAVDLSQWIRFWSYDVMGDLTFGGSNYIELMEHGDPQGLVDSGKRAMIAFEVLGAVPPIFDILWYFPVTRDVHDLDRLAERMIHERRMAEAKGTDISSYLLGHHSKDEEKLTREQLNLDALFAIQAGSDTTSGVMILLLYHLLANRATYDRLMEELNAHCEKGKISEDTVFKLPYLGAVVNEGIRLGTPFPGLPRVVPKGGTVLCGTYIPENTVVSVPAYSQHIHPDNFWPEPEKFRPERWLPGGLGPRSILRTSALMSFSYGPFGCLGRTLAIRELQILTVYLLRSFDIRLAGSFDEQRFVRGVLNMRTTVFEYPLLVDIQQRV